MDELGPQLMPSVLAACRAQAAEVSAAFARAFDKTHEFTIGDADKLDLAAPHAELCGPGLVCLITIGDVAAAVLISRASGILPDWYHQPGADDVGRLAALAKELGTLLLPPELVATDYAAAGVADLQMALAQGNCAAETSLVWFTLAGEKDFSGRMALIWPLHSPTLLWSEPASSAAAAQATAPELATTNESASWEKLPSYSRSLLRIQVPVMVTLARKKHRLQNIVEIVPGTILQFDKACDELLELEVGLQPIGTGECVKVGDKFGLCIASLTLPAERFLSVAPAAQ